MRVQLLRIAVFLVFLSAARPAPAEEINKPPEGFVALFNGRDLTGWQGLIDIKRRATLTEEQRKEEQAKADEKMRAHWSVKDGILVFDGKGDSLQSAKDYGNFELYVDWRIQKEGDRGIYLRGNPQVQIWDAAANPAGSGGLFNNKKHPSAPLSAADRPVGEWNTFWIRMVGDRVTVKLNDKVVVNDTPLENYWEPDKPLPARGPIELQNHGNVLEFRNLYIKELPEAAARAEPAPPASELISLELTNAPLSQLVRILAASGDVEIVLKDPDGKLADRKIALVAIREKTFEQALRIVCSSSGLEFLRDKNGVYFLSSKRY